MVDELTRTPEQPAAFVPAPFLPGAALAAAAAPAREAPAPVTVPAEQAGVGAGAWLLGALGGEWVDEQTFSQIAVDFVLSVIPVVDQAADGRDLAAHVYRLGFKGEHDQWMRWVSLVFTLVGLVPEVGSVIKSASKAALRGLPTVLAELDELLALARRAGVQFPDVGALRRWIADGWPEAQASGLRAWDTLLSRGGELAALVPPLWPGAREAVLKAFADLARVTPEWLPRAFDEVRRMLDDALMRIEQQLAPVPAMAGAVPGAATTDDVFSGLGKEMGSTPAKVGKNWVIPGNWRKAKPEAFRLIFGSATLPDINRTGDVKLTLGHIIEKSTGGANAFNNLIPQLNAVNVKLSGIYARKPFRLKLPSGEEVVIKELNDKPIKGSLREAFQSGQFDMEEQRAISDYLLHQVVGENPEFEKQLAELIKQIPNLAQLLK
jgi:hypothetical protein